MRWRAADTFAVTTTLAADHEKDMIAQLEMDAGGLIVYTYTARWAARGTGTLFVLTTQRLSSLPASAFQAQIYGYACPKGRTFSR